MRRVDGGFVHADGRVGGPEFEALVRTHSPALRQYCRRLAGPVDGDDLMQDTLARAMLGFRRLRDQDRFLPWCRQIARNANASRIRSRHPTEELMDAAATVDVETEVVDGIFRRVLIAEAFAAMPERNRTVLSERAEGVSPAVLAERYGVSRTLVDTWFARSRAQARVLLGRARDGGMLGGAFVMVGRIKASVTARRAIVAAAATGVGATTLLLAVPHLLSPTSHDARVVRFGRVVQNGRSGIAPLAPAIPTTFAVSWAHSAGASPGARLAHRTSSSSSDRSARLDLPGTRPFEGVAHRAEADPVSIGPLLPGDQVVVGIDQCRAIAKVGERVCPPILAGIRIRIAPHPTSR